MQFPGDSRCVDHFTGFQVRVSQGQADNKFRAAGFFPATVDGYRTVMEFHDLFGNGQADAGTFMMMFISTVGLVKPVEDMGQLIFGDSRPGIADGNLQQVPLVGPGVGLIRGHFDFSPRGGEFDRIGQQVGHHFFQPGGIEVEEYFRSAGLKY